MVKNNTKHEILKEALDLFSAYGYEAISIAQIQMRLVFAKRSCTVIL